MPGGSACVNGLMRRLARRGLSASSRRSIGVGAAIGGALFEARAPASLRILIAIFSLALDLRKPSVVALYAWIKYRRRNAGAVTPRQATVLLVFALLTVVATAAMPAVAQDQAAKVRTVTVAAQEDASKCPKAAGPCWDVPIVVVAPGDSV